MLQGGKWSMALAAVLVLACAESEPSSPDAGSSTLCTVNEVAVLVEDARVVDAHVRSDWMWMVYFHPAGSGPSGFQVGRFDPIGGEMAGPATLDSVVVPVEGRGDELSQFIRVGGIEGGSVVVWNDCVPPQCDCNCTSAFDPEPSTGSFELYAQGFDPEARPRGEPSRLIAVGDPGLALLPNRPLWTGSQVALHVRTVFLETADFHVALFLLDDTGAPVDPTFVDYLGEPSATPVAFSPEPESALLDVQAPGPIRALYGLPSSETPAFGVVDLDGALSGTEVGSDGRPAAIAFAVDGTVVAAWNRGATPEQPDGSAGIGVFPAGDGTGRTTTHVQGEVEQIGLADGHVYILDDTPPELRVLDEATLETYAEVDFGHDVVAWGPSANGLRFVARHVETREPITGLIRCEE